MSPPLAVTMVSPEVAPFARTGGLGDVLGSLPVALERLGLRLTLITPAYRPILHGNLPVEDTGISFTVPISTRQETGSLLTTTIGKGITVYFIRSDKYFDRDYLYGTPDGDYPDNAERFAFFSRAALEVLKLHPPDILHAHDWQSSLAIIFLKAKPQLYPRLSSVKTVFTIHNLGYQGIFPPQDWHLLNLDHRLFTPEYLEFWGKINLLKGGLIFADAITTVSPTYAEEINTAEQGLGLEGVFQERADSLVGIMNGADYTVWNPETDRFIAARFGSNRLSGKKVCKADLQRSFQLAPDPEVPVIGMVSRLAQQKGFDLLQEALDELLSRNLQIVLLGTGDKRYRDFLADAAARYPAKLAVRIAFDEPLSHKIIAGSDLLLMPSRYEPGGLIQLYGFKYGSVPIVRATGGLKDTVEEFNPGTGRGNGFVFSSYQAADLLAAVDRSLELFPQRALWPTLVRNGMSADFSWERSARLYLDLYQKLTAGS